MKTRYFLAIIAVSLICLCQFQFSTVLAASDEAAATSALANAQTAVASAYTAVNDAGHAGANISSILNRLNEASDDLGKAGVAYREGDFDLTVSLANVSFTLALEVKSDAEKLRLDAFGPQYASAFFRMTISIFAVIAVALGTFRVWQIFKKRYTEKLMRRKPEILS